MENVLFFSPRKDFLRKFIQRNPKVCVSVVVEVHSDKSNWGDIPNIEFIVLEQHFPPGYEKIVLEEAVVLAKKWHSSQYWKQDFVIGDINIADFSEYHFASKVLLNKIAALLVFQNILNCKSFDKVGIPFYLKGCFDLLNVRQYFIVPSNFTYLKHSFSPLTQNLFGQLLNIFYQFILTVSGWLINIRNTRKIHNKCERVFIGNLHELKPVFDAKYLNQSEEDIIFLQARNLNRYLKIIRINNFSLERVLCWDGIFSFLEFLSVSFRYLIVMFRMAFLVHSKDFQKFFVFRSYKIWPIIKNDFCAFLGAHALAAFKAYYVANNIRERFSFRNCFFGYAHTWNYAVMAGVFKKKGIITETCAHGLIQQMVLYRSSVSVNYSSSPYDLKLMERYSQDERYFLFPRPQEERIASLTLPASQFKRVTILTKPFLDVCSFSYSEDFLLHAFQILLSYGIQINKKNISLKLHPRDSLIKYSRFLTKHNISVNLQLKDLSDCIHSADFVLTPFSTVIFDCIRFYKPFLICNSNVFSNITLIKDLPQSLVYSTGDSPSLVALKMRNLEGIRDYKEFQRIHYNYWGAPPES